MSNMEEAIRIAKSWGFKFSIEYMMMGAVEASITYSPVQTNLHSWPYHPRIYDSEKDAAKSLMHVMSTHVESMVDIIEMEGISLKQ